MNIKKERAYDKKLFLKISLIAVVIGILFWRGYQYYDVPVGMLKRIKFFEEYKDNLLFFDAEGNDITERFFKDNELNYILHNWKSILDYIGEEGTLGISGTYKID